MDIWATQKACCIEVTFFYRPVYVVGLCEHFALFLLLVDNIKLSYLMVYLFDTVLCK